MTTFTFYGSDIGNKGTTDGSICSLWNTGRMWLGDIVAFVEVIWLKAAAG